MGLLPPTFKGRLITINYKLIAYIKHDAWNEFGPGYYVTLPIKIYMPPQQLVSNEQVPQPQNWQP